MFIRKDQSFEWRKGESHVLWEGVSVILQLNLLGLYRAWICLHATFLLLDNMHPSFQIRESQNLTQAAITEHMVEIPGQVKNSGDKAWKSMFYPATEKGILIYIEVWELLHWTWLKTSDEQVQQLRTWDWKNG